MRIKFRSLEELQETHELTYFNEETEKRVEEMLNKEVEVYFDENNNIWSEAGVLLGQVKEL